LYIIIAEILTGSLNKTTWKT